MESKTSRGPVPHHRVDRDLYEKARAKADKEGRSLSSVATSGLERYLSDLTSADVARLRKTAEQRRKSVEVPEAAAARLRKMRKAKDPTLDAHLTAMYEAGWSLRALGRAVEMSGQGVHSRIKIWLEQNGTDGEPAFPAALGPGFIPAYPRRAQAESPDKEPVDWAVWLDRDLYMAASQRAREEGTPMYEVMEDTLRDYLLPVYR